MSKKKSNSQKKGKKKTLAKAEESAVFVLEETKEEAQAQPKEDKKPAEKKKGKTSAKKKTAQKQVTIAKEEKAEKKAEEISKPESEEKPKKRKAPAKKKPAAQIKAETERKKAKKPRKPRREKTEVIIEHYGPVSSPSPGFDLRFFALVAAVIAAAWLAFPKGITGISYEKAELPEVLESPVNRLVINEILAGNTGVFCDANNITGDYAELYNGSEEDISLKGYGLSDTTGKIKWYFPDVTIKKGEYLLVTLSGLSSGDLDASFRLSSSGNERVILYNDTLKVIDFIDTVALNKNNTLQRGEKGEWYVSDKPTPGFENSLQGLDQYYSSLQSQDDGRLVVSEFLPVNKGNYRNENDDDEGFIELYNNSDQPIRLADYFLSGKPDEPFSYRLPDELLQPQNYFVISTGKKTVSLSREYGSLILSSKGKIISRIDYEDLPNGLAVSKVENLERRSAVVSPGYDNNGQGIAQFQKENCLTPAGLIINEVMRNNFSYLKVNGDYYDWVEIMNNSSEPLNLADYRLADSINASDYFQLPDKLLAPGEYYMILFSAQDAATSYGKAGFSLADNSSLYLLKGSETSDVIFVGEMPTGYSYGRGKKEGLFFFDKPTPASANGSGQRAVSFTPEIMQKAGVYDGISELLVEIQGPGEIYYTLNGSKPNRNSTLYTGPIRLTRTTAVKAISYSDGMAESAVSTNSYIINEKHSLPVMSITINSHDFQQINRYYREVDYRKQAYVEYFDGESGFESNCGLGLFGDETRSYSKKNYVMKFDKQFGARNLHYQVFENRDNADYDAISIRAGGQDWREAIIRDHLLSSLVDEYTDVVTYASKTIVVYINGQYWGLYTLREKKHSGFFEDYFNASAEGMSMTRSNGKIEMGDGKAYSSLRYFVNTHNLNIEANYNYVAERLDLVQWADFWIAHTYVANVDYDNVRYIQSPNFNDGKIMAIFYDLDWAVSFGYDYNNYMRMLLNSHFPCTWQDDYGVWHTGIENDIIKKLLRTERFKELWLERLKYNLENTWNTETVLARIDELVAEYEPEIVRNQNRWGSSVSRWYNSIDDLRYFFRHRTYYVLRHTQSWLNISTAKMKEIFGDLYR